MADSTPIRTAIVGCDACEGAGYRGRRAIAEILTTSPTVAVLGIHHEPEKAAFYVPEYLHDEGYRIIFDEEMGKFGLACGTRREPVFIGWHGSFLNTVQGM